MATSDIMNQLVNYVDEFRNLRRNISKIITDKLECEKEPKNMKEIEQILKDYTPVKKDEKEPFMFPRYTLKGERENDKMRLRNFSYTYSDKNELYISTGQSIYKQTKNGFEFVCISEKDDIYAIHCRNGILYLYDGADTLYFYSLSEKRFLYVRKYKNYIVSKGNMFYNQKIDKIIITPKDVKSGTYLVLIDPHTLEDESVFIDPTSEEIHIFKDSKYALVLESSKKGTDTYLLVYDLVKRETVPIENTGRKSIRISWPKNVQTMNIVRVTEDKYIFSFANHEERRSDDPKFMFYEITLVESGMRIKEIDKYDSRYEKLSMMARRELIHYTRDNSFLFNARHFGTFDIRRLKTDYGEKECMIWGTRIYPTYNQDFACGCIIPNPSSSDYFDILIQDNNNNLKYLVTLEYIPSFECRSYILYPIDNDISFSSYSSYRSIQS